MSVFGDMVDAQFEDPNLGLDATYRVGGIGDGQIVRVRRRSPEGIERFGDQRIDLVAMLLDVRTSEVPNAQKGDTFEMLAEDGEPAGTVEVLGNAGIDTRQLVRTLEVQMVQPDPDDDAP